MLNRSHRRFKLPLIKRFVGHTDVLDQKSEGNMLRHFDGTLDLVHCFNAGGAISGRDVDRRRAAASPFVVGIERRMNRMQWNSAGAKPVRDFTDVLLAVGV